MGDIGARDHQHAEGGEIFGRGAMEKRRWSLVDDADKLHQGLAEKKSWSRSHYVAD